MPEQTKNDRPWFTGVMVPATTPFDPVTGEVAPITFRENLRRWTESPLDGIVLFGSTGEGVMLDLDEKEHAIGFAREVMPAHLPLIAGAGAESTRETIRQAIRMGQAGADAVLVSPPAYFGPNLTPAGIHDHYIAVAEASPVPVLIYHIPKFTHVTMEPGLIAELSRHPNLVGLKDSSGDLKRFADYTKVVEDGFKLLVGSGAHLYTALELGAAGGVVALGLLAPEGCADIMRHFLAGDTRLAGEIQTRLTPVHKEIVAPYGAAGLKAALDLLGLPGGMVRPPLRNLSEKERLHLAQVLQQAELM